MSVETTAVSLTVSSVNEVSDLQYNIEATVRPSLNIDLTGRSTQMDVVQWPHLGDLDIPEVKADQVHLLIGQDSSDLLLPTDVKRCKQGEPFALLTPLGWVINGPVNPFGKSTNFSYLIQASVPLEGDMKRLWEIDAFAEEKGWSVSDQRAVDTWNSTLQVIEGHYALSIPFKAQRPSLPDNKFLAEKRLISLTKRLNEDDTLKRKYSEEIHKLLKKRICRSSP